MHDFPCVCFVFQRYLLDGITLQNHPGLIALLRDGESIEDFLKLSPEQILMRWVNFQLEKVSKYLMLLLLSELSFKIKMPNFVGG